MITAAIRGTEDPDRRAHRCARGAASLDRLPGRRHRRHGRPGPVRFVRSSDSPSGPL